MSKYLFYLLVALLVIFCINSGRSSKRGFLASNGQELFREVFPDDTDEDYIPKIISKAQLSSVKFIPGKEFSPDFALKTLFPGNSYELNGQSRLDNSELEGLQAWTCKDCTPKRYNGCYSYGVTPCVKFPIKTGNATWYKDVIEFKDDDSVFNIFMTFNSLASNDPYWFCGHDNCAFMGLAWLRQVPNGWKVVSFSPAIGCYGHYCEIPSIEVVRFGKNNFGCQFLSVDGPMGGGPYFSELYLFGLLQGKFQRLLTIQEAEYHFGPTAGWSMSDSFYKKPANQKFRDLEVSFDGKYYLDTFNTELSHIPIALKPFIHNQDSLEYKITYIYRFDGASYKKVSTKVKHK